MATEQQNGSGKFGKNLYLVSVEDVEGFGGYDTYDSFVACADSKDEARRMYPDGCLDENDVGVNWEPRRKNSCWIKFEDIDKLNVRYLGKTRKIVKGVVLASFNAG
jgi:hypothetical protein